MECSEHKDHGFTSFHEILREKQVELTQKLELCLTTKHEIWLEMKNLVEEVNEIQSRMTSKHQALQRQLDEVLRSNMENIEKFRKSQTEDVQEKLNDLEKYISDLTKSLNETYENPPAQALIQLKNHSLEEVLFKICETVYPTFVEKDLKNFDASALFGNLNIPKTSIRLESTDTDPEYTATPHPNSRLVELLPEQFTQKASRFARSAKLFARNSEKFAQYVSRTRRFARF